MEQLENIFRSTDESTRLPMLNERLNVLHETGSILVKVNLFYSFILKIFHLKRNMMDIFQIASNKVVEVQLTLWN
jgi:hypothetical protein